MVSDERREHAGAGECCHWQPFGQTDAPLPLTCSPVTLASLLPAVQEEAPRQHSLDVLVGAIVEADGRDPHHSLDASGMDLAGG